MGIFFLFHIDLGKIDGIWPNFFRDWTKGKFVQNVVHGASKACPSESTNATIFLNDCKIDADIIFSDDNLVPESTLVDVPETPTIQTSLSTGESETFQNQSENFWKVFFSLPEGKNFCSLGSTNVTNVNVLSVPCKCPADAYGKKSGHSRQITLIDGAINDSVDDKGGTRIVECLFRVFLFDCKVSIFRNCRNIRKNIRPTEFEKRLFIREFNCGCRRNDVRINVAWRCRWFTFK